MNTGVTSIKQWTIRCLFVAVCTVFSLSTRMAYALSSFAINCTKSYLEIGGNGWSASIGVEDGAIKEAIYVETMENGQLVSKYVEGAHLSDFVNAVATPGYGCWILSMNNAAGITSIRVCAMPGIVDWAMGTGLVLQLAGDNFISAKYSETITIDAPGGLRVIGPGTLHIDSKGEPTYGSYKQAAITAGFVEIIGGAIIGMNVKCRAITTFLGYPDIWGGPFEVSAGSALHINCADTSADWCRENDYLPITDSSLADSLGSAIFAGSVTIDGSVLTVISGGDSICCGGMSGGRMSAVASSIHLSSTFGNALDAWHLEIDDCVASITGGENGVQLKTGESDSLHMRFSNLIGVIAGKRNGIYDGGSCSRGSLAITGTATDLVIVGNATGEEGGNAIKLLDGNYGNDSGKDSFFWQSAGKVKLFSPNSVALCTGTNYISGGSLAIDYSLSYGDLQKTYKLSTVASVVEAGIGFAAFGSSAMFTDVLLANMLSSFWDPAWILFNTSEAKATTGISAYALFVKDGTVSVKASLFGIYLRDWNRGSIFEVSSGNVVVHSDSVAILDWGAMEKPGLQPYLRYSVYCPKLIVTGGSLTAEGKCDGILLCGEIVQTGGTLTVNATGGMKPGTLSDSPYLQGYALSADQGYSRSGGTFNSSKGAIRLFRQDVNSNNGAGANSSSTTTTKSSYKIAFNANGGKLPKGKKMAAMSMTYGSAKKLTANKFTRKGYVFLGWAKSKKGAVAYKNKQSVKNLTTNGGTVKLYAKWAKKSYKVKFYANGGKGKMAVQKMTYGKAKKLSANKFTRKGYKFQGWATSKTNALSGRVAYKNKKSVKNLVQNGKTVKLYAVWTINWSYWLR